MTDLLGDVSAFLPHAYCLLQRPGLVALHAVSDLLIMVAYYFISGAILYFLHLREEVLARPLSIFGILAPPIVGVMAPLGVA